MFLRVPAVRIIIRRANPIRLLSKWSYYHSTSSSTYRSNSRGYDASTTSLAARDVSTVTFNIRGIWKQRHERHHHHQQQQQQPRHRRTSQPLFNHSSYLASSTWKRSLSTATITTTTSTNNDVAGGNSHQHHQQEEQHEASKQFYTPEQRYVMDQCKALHASIMPLNEKFRGPLAPHSDRGTALPFVLLLGNHSSGKSSFINYVLGRQIQTTGVAPTDDSFTVIAPGPVDRDQDGPALIGDPDWGFQPLRQFGPTLMHHTALKIRHGINVPFLMVDSPGMIDAPGGAGGMSLLTGTVSSYSGSDRHRTRNSGGNLLLDRGYDFTGVVGWLAHRADVVCLFFDPDKPGTTGETLGILLHALAGMDHKLLIVLNKADQFTKIHDFARAYGSLCWNLSKVIPRKDLPRIYTMCLPVVTGNNDNNSNLSSIIPLQPSPPAALHDLYTAREEVVAEVRKAPERRMDNVITALHDAASQLHMHATILQDVQQRYKRQYWQSQLSWCCVGITGTALTTALAWYGGSVLQIPMQVAGATLAMTVLATGGLYWYQSWQLQTWYQNACSPEQLSAAFRRTHRQQIQENDEYTAALWHRVRDSVVMALGEDAAAASGANVRHRVSQVQAADLDVLESILHKEIPALRRMIAPSHFG